MNVPKALTVAAYALILLAVATFRPVQTPGPFLRDFEAYWSAGAAWNAGADPYGRAIWEAERDVPGVDATHDELLPFVGPPATLLAWSVLARLPYVDAAALWFVVLAIATLALTRVGLRAGGAVVSWTTFLAAVALTLAFGPLTSDLALGQIALIAFLAAMLVVTSTFRSERSQAPRMLASFVALLQPNVAVGLVSQLGRKRSAIAIALGAAGAYLAGAAFSGWSWPAQYAFRLLAHENVERFSAIQLTPAAIAHGAGIAPTGATLVAALAAIGAIAWAIFLWPRVNDAFARFAAFSALTPFAASFFHEHDLIVAYAAATWCAIRARGAVRALAAIATLLVAIDWLGLAQRPTGMSQSALLAVAVACAFAALGNACDWRASAVALAVIAPLFVFGAWLAGSHPAPVWPDALGVFHASSAASTASVWHDELLHSGLLAVNPEWSFLRALSLCGCALLSVSVYLTARKEHAERWTTDI